VVSEAERAERLRYEGDGATAVQRDGEMTKPSPTERLKSAGMLELLPFGLAYQPYLASFFLRWFKHEFLA
jgi:hypothetical protein